MNIESHSDSDQHQVSQQVNEGYETDNNNSMIQIEEHRKVPSI